MVEIEVHPQFNYRPGAADECAEALRCLGFKSVSVSGPRGSHSGEIWVSDKERDEFDKRIEGNKIISTFRDFYIGKRMTYLGYILPNYNVTYLSKHK